MASELQAEIHDNVSGYLDGYRSLAEMEDWLWPFLADLEGDDEEAHNAAGIVGSLISEYSYGDRTEDSMRQDLAAAIRPFEPQPQNYATNDLNQPIRVPVAGTNSNLGSNNFSAAA